MNAERLLKSLRAKKGLTIRDMDKRLSVTGSTYNKYEKNPLKMPLNLFIEVMNVLDGNKDDFLYSLEQDNLSKNKLSQKN